VILEGNYVALNQKPWSDAAELMDLIVFVDVSYETATVRLVKRHLAAGISLDADHALKRARESDMRNGREIVEGKVDRIDVTVKSIDDETWKGEGEKRAEEMHMRGEVKGADGLLQREGLERRDSLAELAESGAGM
jgi:uridine kinase